jgi:transmembrane sensor
MLVAAGDRDHHGLMHPEKDVRSIARSTEDDRPEIRDRHVQMAREEAAAFADQPDYAEFLGTPTLRERLVVLWQRLGNALRGYGTHRFERRLAATTMAVALALGGWWMWPHRTDYETSIAEIRDMALDDGSVVTLGARSALDVRFSKAERTVRLARGEAFFSVSHDSGRPFVVLAGDKRIRVVGTKFNVNFDGDHVRVSVLRGIVQVMPAGDAGAYRTSKHAGSVTLVAGQQLLAMTSTPLGRPQPLGGAQPDAWRTGRLTYQDASLAEIVADANRYYGHDIRIVSPSLMGERLTTSFRTTQIDQMLETLPASLPIEVKRDSDGTVELSRASAPGQ